MPWDWLNSNASGVQAAASVVTLAATVALVTLTRRYVQLTKSIAETSAAQQQAWLDAQHEERTRAVAAFLGHLARIQAELGRLYAEAPQEGELRRLPVPSHDDASLLGSLAARVSAEVSAEIVTIQTSIRLIADLTARVRAVQPSLGYLFSQFEIEDYRRARGEALDRLIPLVVRAGASLRDGASGS